MEQVNVVEYNETLGSELVKLLNLPPFVNRLTLTFEGNAPLRMHVAFTVLDKPEVNRKLMEVFARHELREVK